MGAHPCHHSSPIMRISSHRADEPVAKRVPESQPILSFSAVCEQVVTLQAVARSSFDSTATPEASCPSPQVAPKFHIVSDLSRFQAVRIPDRCPADPL